MALAALRAPHSGIGIPADETATCSPRPPRRSQPDAAPGQVAPHPRRVRQHDVGAPPRLPRAGRALQDGVEHLERAGSRGTQEQVGIRRENRVPSLGRERVQGSDFPREREPRTRAGSRRRREKGHAVAARSPDAPQLEESADAAVDAEVRESDRERRVGMSAAEFTFAPWAGCTKFARLCLGGTSEAPRSGWSI